MIKCSAEKLKDHLSAICRPRDAMENYDALAEMEGFLEHQFSLLGYRVKKDPFHFQGRLYHNIIATQYQENEKPRLILGAHFDAVPGTEGADDNGSGMAVLLESARLLSESASRQPVDFIAFNVEEYGMIGSSRHVNRLKREKTELAGMISLEMVGFTSREKGSQKIPLFLKPFYPDVGNFLALVGNSRSKNLLHAARAAFQSVSGLCIETLTLPFDGRLIPASRLSDHSPFWDAGYPALLATDTSFFRNPYYHTPGDKIATLDLEFMAQVTDGVACLVRSFF